MENRYINFNQIHAFIKDSYVICKQSRCSATLYNSQKTLISKAPNERRHHGASTKSLAIAFLGGLCWHFSQFICTLIYHTLF